MKKLHEPHNDLYECEVTEGSIESAIRYLVDESLRLNDLQGAAVLRNALADYKSKHEAKILTKAQEKTALNFLKKFMSLNDDQKDFFIAHLELMYQDKNPN